MVGFSFSWVFVVSFLTLYIWVKSAGVPRVIFELFFCSAAVVDAVGRVAVPAAGDVEDVAAGLIFKNPALFCLFL